MRWKQKVERRAKELGAEVDVDKRFLLAWAPRGFVWRYDDVHALGAVVVSGSLESAWEELYEWMSEGTSVCVAAGSGCEVCDAL